MTQISNIHVNLLLSIFDQCFQVFCAHHISALTLSLPAHGFLYNGCDFLSGLVEDFIHILSHWVVCAKILVSRLSCLGIGVKRRLILFQEFLFNSNVVVGNAQNSQTIFRLLDCFPFSFLCHYFSHKFILDENQSFH